MDLWFINTNIAIFYSITSQGTDNKVWYDTITVAHESTHPIQSFFTITGMLMICKVMQIRWMSGADPGILAHVRGGSRNFG
jgi:hypothetical protein